MNSITRIYNLVNKKKGMDVFFFFYFGVWKIWDDDQRTFSFWDSGNGVQHDKYKG
jgi:hypothetical protein